MMNRLLLLAALVMPATTTHRAPSPQSDVFATHARPAWAEDDPADSLYRKAREALNDEDYRRAAGLFAQIGTKYPKSAYAAEALYFRAYALYRSGSDSDLRDALTSLEAHKERFPKARTTSDANQLAMRINGELAKRGDASSAAKVADKASSRPESCDDNDVRAEAMNALLQMDAQSALPIIKKVMERRDTCSTSLRKKAVFLLSQKGGSESESMLIDAIKGDPNANVREEAIFWLGQVHSERAASTLEELAGSSPDVRVRDKALFALTQQNTARASAFMRKIATSSDVPSKTRSSAVFNIGQHQSQENADFLKELFTKSSKSDDAFRKGIMFSLSQMHGFGNDRWLLNLALDQDENAEIRKHALFCAGQAGISGTELASLYDRITDREVKKQLIWVMSDSRDGGASDKLVQIAQKDRDAEMRKTAIFWLGQKNDPRVRQILLDIINKP